MRRATTRNYGRISQNAVRRPCVYQGRENVLTFDRTRVASTTPSFTPRPESFTPPNGERSVRNPGVSFTFTVPVRTPLITCTARSIRFVTTPVDNPYAVALARLIASA